MASSWQYALPTRIVFGRGSFSRLAEELARLGRRGLIVSYQPPNPLEDLVDHLTRQLKVLGLESTCFGGLSDEPDVLKIAEAMERLRAFRADWVLGLGGGSVLDTAKLIGWLTASQKPASALVPQNIAEAKLRQQGRERSGEECFSPAKSPSLPVVAVPTTAGSGSEVTEVAVIRCSITASEGQDTEKQLPVKWTVSHPGLRPALAVIDPSVLDRASPELLWRGVADALAQAIEAYLSRAAGDLTNLFAAEAVRLIGESLPALQTARSGAGDQRAVVENSVFEKLSLAAMLAGLALNGAGVTVAHAMAHGLGAVLGWPHAAAVAVASPVCLRWNAAANASRILELRDRAGWGHRASSSGNRATPALKPPEPAGESPEGFVEEIAGVWRQAAKLACVEIAQPITPELIDRLVQSTEVSSVLGLRLNPRRVTRENLAELFREVLTSVQSPDIT